MISRREFLKYAGIAGAAATLPLKFGVRSAHAFSNSMPLAKFTTPMRTFGIPGPTGFHCRQRALTRSTRR